MNGPLDDDLGFEAMIRDLQAAEYSRIATENAATCASVRSAEDLSEERWRSGASTLFLLAEKRMRESLFAEANHARLVLLERSIGCSNTSMRLSIVGAASAVLGLLAFPRDVRLALAFLALAGACAVGAGCFAAVGFHLYRRAER